MHACEGVLVCACDTVLCEGVFVCPCDTVRYQGVIVCPCDTVLCDTELHIDAVLILGMVTSRHRLQDIQARVSLQSPDPQRWSQGKISYGRDRPMWSGCPGGDVTENVDGSI